MRLAVALIAAMMLLGHAQAEESPWPLTKVRVEAEQWGYRPVSGAVAVNPRGFIGAPEDSTYRIATDNDVAASVERKGRETKATP